MARAMVPGLLQRGMPANRILVVDPFAQARERLQADHRLPVFESAQALRAQVNERLRAAVWAVKPDTFPLAAVQASEAGVFGPDTLHLSVMAGTSTASLARQLGSMHIVRAMPNQAALIGQAITGMYAPDAVSAEERAVAAALMETLGRVEWVDREAQMHAVTALSGSGPAYMFEMLKAMKEAGERLGLDSDQALRLAVQTMAGAAELARGSPQSLDELISQVRSPGGTTHAALQTMGAQRVFEGFKTGIQAAHDRSVAMGGSSVASRPDAAPRASAPSL